MTSRYSFLYDVPQTELAQLASALDVKVSPERLDYYLSFITLNHGMSPRYSPTEHGRAQERATQLKFNLLFFVAMQRSGAPFSLFAAQHNRQLLDTVSEEFMLGEYVLAEGIYPRETILRDRWAAKNQLQRRLVLEPQQKAALLAELERLILEVLPKPHTLLQDIAPEWYGRGVTSTVVLVEAYQDQFDPAFLQHPRQYLKRQRTVRQIINPREPSFDPFGGVGKAVGRLSPFNFAGPVSPGANVDKVRTLRLRSGQQVYVKRVDPLRVRYPEEEIEIAERVNTALQAADPRFHAQQLQALWKGLNVADPEGPLRLKDILVSTDPDGSKHYPELLSKVDSNRLTSTR